MTITEAIKHCEELSETLERNLPNYAEPVVDFRQIADWLRELKEYREIITNAPRIIIEKYGSDIIEGYADIYDMLREVKADECNL